MLSEWLSDKPLNFESEWITVICPIGRRSLVIANRVLQRTRVDHIYTPNYCLLTMYNLNFSLLSIYRAEPLRILEKGMKLANSVLPFLEVASAERANSVF